MEKIRNYSDQNSTMGRRSFLKEMTGVAAAASLPIWHTAEQTTSPPISEAVSKIPKEQPAGDERFWSAVKAQFPIRKGLVMLNAANLCPTPSVVQQKVFDYTLDIDADASFQNRAKYDKLRQSARLAIAAYLSAGGDEIALVRNTSEGNNTVISGLNLKAGDEVLIWDQNHPTANVAWDARAERYGYSVKRITTPENPADPEELTKSFTQAFTPKTKVLAFSHVSNLSGVRLDADRLCREAHAKGILTLVDGAQTFGTYPLDLHGIRCDFFTGSSHKWFCGPKEVGILYIRKGMEKRLHPLSVGVGWEQAREKGAEKFETLGQRDDSRIAAMNEAVKFHQTIGSLRISTRARILADAAKARIKRKIPGVSFLTPTPHSMSWGVVVFKVAGIDSQTALDKLYQLNVGCAVMGDNIRFSPHIYNTLEEIERSVEALNRLRA